ncbi:HAD family acid phosphatase [Nocardioides halotolerans]|uniref:HAD family acid phosphatase n=1 Tax=Nocardioides halotolerans TaxID=433660 RepID=UPI000400A319|nr:HAD family acid phosphatase [Nocardioides halotolerans]
MTRLLRLLAALAVAAGLASVPPAASASAPAVGAHPARWTVAAKKVPTRAQWLADVKAAMQGFGPYVRQRVAAKSGDEELAVNFDIDNTVIATYYDGGGAIPRMRRFARMLDRLDVAVVFNSGRVATQQARTVSQLTRAGFPVTEVCLRPKGGALVVGKQRCRDHFADEGYTLIANVGNNDTDFVGDGYERAYRLPNYGVLG